LDEEKRLLYVAMTRAKKNLYLIYAEKRRKKLRKISRFFSEFETFVQEEVDEKKRTKILKKKQMNLL
jgi:superfamily I DNA/RNA helicase